MFPRVHFTRPAYFIFAVSVSVYRDVEAWHGTSGSRGNDSPFPRKSWRTTYVACDDEKANTTGPYRNVQAGHAMWYRVVEWFAGQKAGWLRTYLRNVGIN